MAFAVWVTGLPGSGKSATAKAFLKLLKIDRASAVYLSMDTIRKKLIKNPKYSEKERDFAYRKFADIGISEFRKGRNVVFDATAHKLKYRDYARNKIANFVEVLLSCPLKICIERETNRKNAEVMKEIYKKAMTRKRTGKMAKGLGKVVGIDVPYELNKNAEVVIDSSKTDSIKAAKIILDYLYSKHFFHFSKQRSSGNKNQMAITRPFGI